MAFGGLGVSLAGFAGLISALDRRPAANSALVAWRIRNIVFLGFSLTFLGFGTVALYTITGADLTLTVRLASLLAVLPGLRSLVFETRPGPAWPNERQRKSTIGVLSLLLALTLGNVAVANVGYLQVLMLTILITPAAIFYNTISDATRSNPAAMDPDTTEVDTG